MFEVDENHKYGLIKTSRTTWQTCNCKVCNGSAKNPTRTTAPTQ